MASIAARVKALEKEVRALKKLVKTQKADIAKMQKCCKQVLKWIKTGSKNEVKWSKEVTKMLHQIDWADLAAHFPGGGGDNPPQTPPDWPPTD